MRSLPPGRLIRPASFVLLVALAAVPARAQVPDQTPPTASLRPPGALDAPAVLTFDEPVRGVGDHNVVVRTSGGSRLPASLECRSVEDLSVPCAAGGTLTAVMRPAAPLVSGHAYTLQVNPLGADPIVDLAGNAAARTARPFLGSLVEQETSVRAAYRWRPVRHRAAHGGSYVVESAPGARAAYRFSGTEVTWYTVAGPAYGLSDVFVDGEHRGRFNNHEPRTRYRVARRFGGLLPGDHRIEIVAAGKRGHRRGGRLVAVDAFGIASPLGSQLEATPSLRARWRSVAERGASGGRYVMSDQPGATLTYTFRGTGFDWESRQGPRHGRAAVYVDGRRRATFDGYSRVSRFVRWPIRGLSDRRHTVTIKVLSRKRSASRGRWVAVDRLIARIPPDVAAFRGLAGWVDLWDRRVLQPESAVRAMARRGVRTVFLQTSRWNSRWTILDPAEAGRWVDAAHDHGLRVVGWYVPGYRKLDRDVGRTIAIKKFQTPRGDHFDALAIDIEERREVRYDPRRFNRGVSVHLRRVRRAAGPSYAVGAIVPPPQLMKAHPRRYPRFPWPQIGRNANVVMPMSYWSNRRSWCRRHGAHCAYDYTVGNVRAARQLTGLPVHVIGGIARRVSTRDVRDYVLAAWRTRARGGGLYDFRSTHRSFWSRLGPINRL